MSKRHMFISLTLCLVMLVAAPVLAQESPSPAEQAVSFLETVQNQDGGFSNGFSPESDISTTADAVVAIAATGQDPNALFVGTMMNPLTYLGIALDDGSVSGAGQLAKVLTAMVAAGKDPTDVAGRDLVADLLALQAEDGIFGNGAFDHCLATIALQNAAGEIPANAHDALLAAQNEDGGWGFMPGTPSDTNTTALCLQALAPVEAADSVAAGFAYLAAIQNEDGGWPYQNPNDFGTDSDTSSTALVVQALIAHEEDPAEWSDPAGWLLTMQNDSGSFSYQAAMPGDNILATIAVIPAIQGLSLNAWAPDASDS